MAPIGFVNKNYFGTAAAAVWVTGLGPGWAPNTRARGVRRGTASTARWVWWVWLDEAGQGGDEEFGAESLSSLGEPRAPAPPWLATFWAPRRQDRSTSQNRRQKREGKIVSKQGFSAGNRMVLV